jgi:HAMP domain-containing protein
VPLLHPVNLGDRSHFRRAIAERRFIAGDYVFGRVIKKHTINLTYPVIDRAAMCWPWCSRPWTWKAWTPSSTTSTCRPARCWPPPMRAAASSRAAPIRNAISAPACPPTTLEAMSTAGQRAVTIRGEDGVERLHTFARVGAPALSDYTVTIGIPTDTITSAARHDQLMSLLGLAATTMLALLAAWLVGDVLIVQRVRKLMGTAERIAAGDLDARSGIDYAHEEIGNLAQALDRMAASLQKKESARSLAERELRAADQRKDEFLAMLAHELRNPLAPISTGAHLLKLLHSDNAQITQTCSIIVRQVDHMTSLVDDLLDVSRVTRGLVSLSTQVLDLQARGRRRRRADPAADHGAPASRGDRPAALAGPRQGRPQAPGAGGRQPAEQRDQVHAGRRHPAAAPGRRRRRLRA